MGIIKIDNPKIELEEIIAGSQLGNERKETWYEFIGLITEEDVIPILKTLKENPVTLDFLTENLEKKAAIMQSGNETAWRDVLEKEKDFIETE